ncbi:MAG: hypothetical protein AABX02_00330 [archaeon]
MASIFTTGRVCYKTTGRDAGSKVIVIEAAKNGFAIVEGAATKKGRANISHLLATTQKVELPKTYTRKDLQKLLEKGE